MTTKAKAKHRPSRRLLPSAPPSDDDVERARSLTRRGTLPHPLAALRARAGGGEVVPNSTGEEGVSLPAPNAPTATPPAGDGGHSPELLWVSPGELDLGNRFFDYRMTRDVDWMKEELRKGQKLPVIVRGRAAPYQVIAGFTRAEAAAALAADGGTERVMVHRYAELDDARAWEIAYTENDKRKSITDLDRLHLAHRMRTEGRTVAEVAALLGRGERIVTYYLSLARTLEEIPTLRTALRERRISTTHAYVLCEHQETLGTEAVADLVARVAAENLSVRALKALVRPAPARQTYRETPDGFTLPRVVFSPEKASPAEARQLLQDLERAVEKLRRHIQSDE